MVRSDRNSTSHNSLRLTDIGILRQRLDKPSPRPEYASIMGGNAIGGARRTCDVE
jgi:hypothetical protein